MILSPSCKNLTAVSFSLSDRGDNHTSESLNDWDGHISVATKNQVQYDFFHSLFGFLSQLAPLLARLNVEVEELLAGLVECNLDRGQAWQALSSSLLDQSQVGAGGVLEHGGTGGGGRAGRSRKRSNCISRLDLHVNIGRLAARLQPQGGWGGRGSHNHHVGKLVGTLLAPAHGLHFGAGGLTTAARLVVGVEHILTRAGL